MMIYKDKGLIYSQYILEDLSRLFICGKQLLCRVETFYNCRELGYLFIVQDSDYTKRLQIWVYAQRNSDEPTITYKEETYNNMFDDDAWLNNTFTFKSIEKASEKAKEIIINYFKVEEE